jgi:hypothetical protein
MIYTNSDKFWFIIILTNLSIFVFIFLESDGIITCTSTDTNNDPMELPYGQQYKQLCQVFFIPATVRKFTVLCSATSLNF